MPKVFISYSHDSPEHKQWVLKVSEQLRTQGLECQIDQYVKGFPDEGWPSWMEKHIEQANYVLIVCSPLYLQRFRCEDTEGGRGVALEGSIITQTLYDHYCRNKKFIPVVSASGSIDHVPPILKSFTTYRLPDDYDLLYRLLTDQPAVVPGNVGSIKVMPPENTSISTHTTHTDQLPAESSQPAQSTAPSSTPLATYDPRIPAFLVPFRSKGKFMVGRDKALEKVRQQLLEGKPTSIGQTALFQGIGGLGKTQLAVEYTYQYRDDYPNGVYWITADENIDAQLTQIAVAARWVAPESEHTIKLDVARHRLKSYSGCLIVFDNLESVDAIRDYLPEPSANPHILVTSRSEQAMFTDVKLELLNDEQSLLMLLQEAKTQTKNQEEESATGEIVAALGGLPLALELAGAYLAHRPIGWCAYCDLLRENLKQALPTQLASLTRHEADLFKTLAVSEQDIDEEPLLGEVLDLLTWSSSSPMSLRLMAHLIDVQPDQLYGALGLGVALRLLQQVPDSERYAVHRLVQEVRRQDRPLVQHNDWANEIMQRLGDWFEAIRADFRELPVFELEFDHLRAWQVHAERSSPITSARLLWLQAYPAYHRGRYNDALRIVQQALSANEAQNIGRTPLKANLLSDLAYCLSSLGDGSRALELDQQALEMRRELLGDKHPDIASSLGNLASNYSDLGNYPRALELGQQALDMRRELLGDKHPAVASSLGNLAGYYSYLGNYPRALELGQQALEMRRELLGASHPHTIGSLQFVAKRLYGNPSTAGRGKALVEEFLRHIPRDHPSHAKVLSFLGTRNGFRKLGKNGQGKKRRKK